MWGAFGCCRYTIIINKYSKHDDSPGRSLLDSESIRKCRYRKWENAMLNDNRPNLSQRR